MSSNTNWVLEDGQRNGQSTRQYAKQVGYGALNIKVELTLFPNAFHRIGETVG